MIKSNKIKAVALLAVFLLSTATLSFGKSSKTDESRPQVGLGINMSTANIFGFVQSISMIANKDYSSLGLSPEVADEVPENVKQTLAVANIFAAMEYSIQLRFLASVFMLETDLTILPMDNASSGRIDMLVGLNLGLRAPFWLMPYITVGANFTFSWYPDKIAKVETWRSLYGVKSAGNFAWSPGINAKIGLDIKFRRFSAGLYYTYVIKDFNEFTTRFRAVFMDISNGNTANAVGLLIGSQSRFGISVCWYLM
ncbi:MAG TPA: hypothetical protein PLG34_04575 [Spirochaetota bacterium]|jgi:hypothetical protein|nr:MAG: hypothetical protein BWX91_01589 [Spirochaetes bacterium ADurb.Bin133]HNZ26915.1 hypothetical protein [Spirochaetota bacterium]HPY87237.1 hypothetical protein [Spirochaetota bacterium]